MEEESAETKEKGVTSKASSRSGSRRSSKAGLSSSKRSSPKTKKRTISPKTKSSKGVVNEPDTPEEISTPEGADGGIPEIQPPIVAKKVQTPQKPSVVHMLKERIMVTNLKTSMWEESHNYALEKFLEDPGLQLMIAYMDQYRGFVIEFTIPGYPIEQMTYFIKCQFTTKLTADNFHKIFRYGSLQGQHLQSLLRLMDGFFAPAFFENTSWPDSIQNEFASHLHRFLAKLTDTRWRLADKTVLYVPMEGLKTSPEEAARKKEYIQRLEAAMIHWIRQIKEVLATQNAYEIVENTGPLHEIEFWNRRCTNLTGISKQLDKSGVKKVTEILTFAKSSYIEPFLKVSEQIKEGSKQAESNLKFLMMLKDPCFELSQSKPADIPKLLPKILNYIRIIWVNAPYYTSRERLTSLFKKVSNEIISRCRAALDLDRLFDGYVQSGLLTLKQCIDSCEGWKDLYEKTSKMQHKLSPVPWVLDISNIFAQTDAFVQRCKDLTEVCNAQVHFARMEDGNKSEMPQFAGQKGPEVAKGLLEIEKTFNRMLRNLGLVKNKILDVKVTSWHDDFNRFRDNMKDLEIMMQNMMDSAFETVKTVEGGVELLDIFCHLSPREAIKRMIDKKTKDVFIMFNAELNCVKVELSSKPELQMSDHPKYAGLALWARHLKNRIQRNMNLLSKSHFLPFTGTGEEVRGAFIQLNQALDEYMRKTFHEWTLCVVKDPMKLLDIPLMCRSTERPPMLDINFDKRLEKIFQEVHYWERLNFDIPHYVRIAYNRREDLRNLKEHVLLVVRDYNRIIAALSYEERALFRERIRFLDKKIHPGLSKLTWVSHGISEYFVTDCRNNASKVQVIVDDYKGANTEIADQCVKISELLLIKIIPRKVYEKMDFDSYQTKHREIVTKRLTQIHENIVRTMKKTHEIFRLDGSEVQVHWHKYTEKMDKMVEEAFRLNVKWSLQELSKSINGDGKNPPNPMFKVKVLLKDKKVELEPSLSELAYAVSSEYGYITSALSQIQRLPSLLTPKESVKEPIYEMIARSEEARKIHSVINTGMQTNATHMLNYIKTWDNYREIWEIDKGMFIQRYQNLGPVVSSFDSDIARYDEVANNVEAHETIEIIQFMMIDCSPLKTAIMSHCREWQTKFTQLLKKMSTTSLMDLQDYLVENGDRINQLPQTLSELGISLNLWDKLHNELEATEEKFAPLAEQFQILEKYQVTVEEKYLTTQEKLKDEWFIFQESLKEAEGMLKKHKDIFKAGLLAQSDEFKKKVHFLLDNFQKNGPFTSTIGTGEALESISVVQEQLMAFKKAQQEIRDGLNIFKIDQPPNKEIAFMEKDLQYIEDIWLMNKEWETSWAEWKVNKFVDLQTETMEATAIADHKKLLKYSKLLADRNWEVVETSKNRVDQFKRTMPLINDLKNTAMRKRHWDKIQNEMGKDFDHKSNDFTLEKIIEMGFDHYAELIHDISEAATKELVIEQGLEVIEAVWNTTDLEIIPYKDRGHYKLVGVENVFSCLDENQIRLSSMKASRFIKAFETDVDRWEKILSNILEVIEILLLVQKEWMYLENIFLGEDIRKQLPRESSNFDEVNVKWKAIMTRMHADKNALRCTHYQGLLDELNEMNKKLESIQKSLEAYLETKRGVFPRFYFISNDDLLEILGQSKTPNSVQPHLKKLFDNISFLDMKKEGKHIKAISMNSEDGEKVEFINSGVFLDGQVENWLGDVEAGMVDTLMERLVATKSALKKSKKDKWLKEHPGQLCIVASQIQWTSDTEKALKHVRIRGDKKPLRTMKKKQVTSLNRYSEIIRSNLTKMQRLKVTALVTIEVHARDVIEKLVKSGCNDENAFEWLCHLRYYMEKDQADDVCVIKQTNTDFRYGCEYLDSRRLVITPLTDRCYITLTTALHLHRGGSPKGPAGTGKTETVKDLGKALGMYVIVVNCSEGLDFRSMGRMFSGLAQTGAWGCFDEFNRINIEVLSVVAQQILSILSALSSRAKRFTFERREITLIPTCGIFITMNPGYAGRTELPDNLKSMFRPIAMVSPDSTLIAEIILFGEGFNNCKGLARKTYTLYSLAEQQLSKQDHYDFGLRALVSVLRYAGPKRRTSPNLSDEEVLILSMKDMNAAKLTSADLSLFNGIISDLFPGIEMPTVEHTIMKNAIVAELKSTHLQAHTHSIKKAMQLYETKSSRHSVMIVGGTQSGKTTAWKTLQGALIALFKKGDENFQNVKVFPLNAKALSLGELYGEFEFSTNDWTDGILSSIMRNACTDKKPDERWILFDGPVDTLWIESMNSVMDDNKILTLINGERISLPEQVSLLFEVGDLSVASPATVSRCGMVYADYEDLKWLPYVESWLQTKKENEVLVEELKKMFDKYLVKILTFKKYYCQDLISIAPMNGVRSLCKLFDALATPENGIDQSDQSEESLARIIELWFLFCMIWSIGASVDEDGRKRLDNFIREIEGTFPNRDTIYEYYVEPKGKSWIHWDEQLKAGWKYDPSMPFYKIIVPTVDTVRYQYLVSTLIDSFNPVLLVGPVGTGKTSVANKTLRKSDQKSNSVLTINMSAHTTSNQVQEIIESRVEKRTKGVYVPIGGKKLLTFMDDFNMPAKDTFGSQPPLELMKLWLDYGFWYDREKQTQKEIREMFLIAAMGPPGGGRQVICPRLQSRFNLINMTFPQDNQIHLIFGGMLNQKLQEFEEDIKPLGDIITKATIEVYLAVQQKFKPTPSRMHYLFNLRDISKVFQGMLRAHKHVHDTKNAIIRLWIHECFRVFSDRLVDTFDYESFVAILTEKLASLFDQTFHNLCPNKQPPVFGDFLNEEKRYEDITDIGRIRDHLNGVLEKYNNTPGTINMDLVMFRDAIEHVVKIVRVIRQPCGNMLLVGIGGSGHKSLTRLASFMCGMSAFEIEISKLYRRNEFKDDLKRLYWQTGVLNKPTVFIFSDSQVVEEEFLEDINNILSSGEIPSLYNEEEFEEVRNELLEVAQNEGIEDTQQSVFSFLIGRVRSNLHVVLCMSPVGEPFRNRVRKFPAFVNCTTIDWFSEWPIDALNEVADKYLQDVTLDMDKEDKIKPYLVKMFSAMHKSVSELSRKMLLEMKRHNYVTPTNYLEFVSGYKKLLYSKRKELGDQANKLKNGLSKIDETRAKVKNMTEELEDARVKVIQYQKTCDEYLINIVQQKRDADEQQKTVTIKSERIGEEEAKCKHMADIAQHDLDEAMPALKEAIEALDSLNKNDITEIRSYGRPPAQVEKVMEAVMILRGNEPTWSEAKKQLGDNNFINKLVAYDKDNISDKMLKKISSNYVNQSDFRPEIVGRVSLAAKSLCLWVRAMELYGRVYRVVQPKQQRLNVAMKQLQEKQDALAEAQQKLAEVKAKMEELKRVYDEKLEQKEDLKRKADYTEMMLERAAKLVEGLAEERVRWEETVQNLKEKISTLPGDCMLAAAFMSYMGPFLSNYREKIVKKLWIPQIAKLGIPCTPTFEFSEFMARPTQVREWNIQGLPSDSFSTENGVIVTTGSRWPLMVDPQGQAIKWIKNKEAEMGLKVIDFQQADYMKYLESGIHFGTPVLLQNVREKLEPSLDPILNKSLIKKGGITCIKVGDKEIEYNSDFRFYITTKLGNPHYMPDISTKTTIVNFAVKEQGLQAQFLGIVVKKEKAELEETKDQLVKSIASGKKKLEECEDEILRLLNETKGSLLDDEQLVNTLQTSKMTSQEVSEKLQISEQTEHKIDAAREGYRSCAQRAAILFFVLNDMGMIDPMYQFSLDSYIELFLQSIDRSQKSQKLDERIVNLNEYHTYAVYKYACRGLFERHKLLMSFQMCVKILEAVNKINMDEYSFFLHGGIVMDRDSQIDNPCSNWLSDTAWDNITELDKLTNFHGIITSFEQYPKDWHTWYSSAEPEKTPLPGEWENACNELQKMLFVRSLRPDRVSFCCTTFILNHLGVKFTEPPALDMSQVIDDCNCKTPLIFILSNGADPTNHLLQLAESKGLANNFNALSLGQGQAPIATRLIKEGIREGNWVFLANCHLSLSWMPHLHKIIEQFQTQKPEPHPEFRLWLSSSPHPDFPITILQTGLKMTTEPPKGLKANLKRLYTNISDSQFQRCPKQDKYKKLLFSLCYFHSLLLERKKFLTLGWNILYEFNDSDFEVSENLMCIYLDHYEETPWEAMKFLVAGIVYGGHVTDDWDRRLLMTYINDYFQDGVISTIFYQLSSLPTYYIPKDGPLAVYREYVSMLPNVDHPEAFGQHSNADIQSQIQETKMMFDTLLSLQPTVSLVGSGESREDKVLNLAANIYKQIPDDLDYEGTVKILEMDHRPINIVLLQEIERYNTLMGIIRTALTNLEQGIKGLVVMTMELENTFQCIFDGRVPPTWLKAYPSLKPLASWTRDLVVRVEQLSKWSKRANPPFIYWIPGFTLPTGFLTAVLQTSARQNNVSIDTLSWEFSIMTVSDENIIGPPKDGVYVKGLFLQGAGWDMKNSCLVEAKPMELVCPVPTIHFKPVENKKKSAKGIYTCPCYYYPNRAGSGERSSFIVGVDMKAGEKSPDHWVKRGTALLMSLDY
ncbi:dynein axonemal heavy chain 2-like [Mytilus edulis]